MLEQQRADVLLSDLRMPEEDGFALTSPPDRHEILVRTAVKPAAKNRARVTSSGSLQIPPLVPLLPFDANWTYSGHRHGCVRRES